MSEDGTSLILRLLRDIRATQDEHGRELATLNKKFDDWQRKTATGLGLASYANIRNTAIEAELEALKRRGGALEGSLGTAGH